MSRSCAGFRAREPARDHVGRLRRLPEPRLGGSLPARAAAGGAPAEVGAPTARTSVSAGCLVVGGWRAPSLVHRRARLQRREEAGPRLRPWQWGRSGPRRSAPGTPVGARDPGRSRARGGAGSRGARKRKLTVVVTVITAAIGRPPLPFPGVGSLAGSEQGGGENVHPRVVRGVGSWGPGRPT